MPPLRRESSLTPRFLALFASLCALSACTSRDAPADERFAPQRTALQAPGTVEVSAELGTDTPAYGIAGTTERERSVASDGAGTALVVWAVNGQVRGARVDASGATLDPSGIPIFTNVEVDPYVDTSPSVAHGGGVWLVVWEDHRSGSYGIYGARVTADGSVLDPDGFTIATRAGADLQFPRVAYNGTSFLVAWRGSFVFGAPPSAPAVFAARVSPAGQVLDNPTAPLAGPGVSHAVASDGTNWLLAYAAGASLVHDIQAVRLGPTLSVLGATQVTATASGDEDHPALGYNGTGYFVAWDQSGRDVFGTRLSTAGVVADPSGIPIATANGDQVEPSVAYDGTNWLVSWSDRQSGNVIASRISSAGAVLDASGIAVAAAAYDQSDSAVARVGANSLVVWGDGRGGGGHETYGGRVSQTGVVLDPQGFPFSRPPNAHILPAVAFGGGHYLAVWTDGRAPGGVYGTRYDLDGRVLDANGIAIATGAVFEPSAAHNGKQWLVVWQDYRNGSDYDVFAARVSAAGTVLDPAGIPVTVESGNQLTPSVASDGTGWLVVWGTDVGPGVFGARVAADGSVSDPSGLTISTTGRLRQRARAAAWDGAEWLVVFEDFRSGTQTDVYGARVAPNGTVLDPTGFAIATSTGTKVSPSVAADGTRALVVWHDRRDDDGFFDAYNVYGARLARDGSVLDPNGIAIGTAGYNQVLAAASGNGRNWLVTWEDARDGVGSDIYAARVSAEGGVLDPTGLVISARAPREEHAGVAAGPSGAFMVVYHSTDGPSRRVRGRLVSRTCVDPNDPICDSGEGGAGGEGGAAVGGEAGQPGTGGSGVGGGGTGGSSAGAAGEGGEAGESTGGAGGSGRGGSAGTSGGSGGGGTGASGGSGGSAGSSGDDDDDGCGCRVGRRSPSRMAIGFALLGLALAARRRRGLSAG